MHVFLTNQELRFGCRGCANRLVAAAAAGRSTSRTASWSRSSRRMVRCCGRHRRSAHGSEEPALHPRLAAEAPEPGTAGTQSSAGPVLLRLRQRQADPCTANVMQLAGTRWWHC